MTTLSYQRPNLAEADSDELRVIDSYLLAAHEGRLAFVDRLQLDRLVQTLGITGAELDTRQKRIVARKDARRKANEPNFIGKPRVLRVPGKEKTKLMIGYAPGGNHGFSILDFLRADNRKPMPDLYETEWFPAPDIDAEAFDYLCGLLVKIDSGELKPGNVATVAGPEDKLRPLAGISGIPHFRLDELPITLRIERFAFVRLPSQSQHQLDARVKELRDKSAELDRGIQ